MVFVRHSKTLTKTHRLHCWTFDCFHLRLLCKSCFSHVRMCLRCEDQFTFSQITPRSTISGSPGGCLRKCKRASQGGSSVPAAYHLRQVCLFRQECLQAFRTQVSTASLKRLVTLGISSCIYLPLAFPQQWNHSVAFPHILSQDSKKKKKSLRECVLVCIYMKYSLLMFPCRDYTLGLYLVVLSWI